MSKNTVFIAIDGESIDGQYILLGTTLGPILESKKALTTDACLSALIELSNKYYSSPIKDYVFVGFGINYDVEMIMKTLPQTHKKRLFYQGKCKYNDIKITYIPRKFLRLEYPYKDSTREFTWYDSYSFFLGNFISVVEKQLGQRDDVLAWGKSTRGQFTWKDYEEVKKYNTLECRLLSEIMRKLQANIKRCGVNLTSWYGASALAQATMAKWKVDENYTPIKENFIQDKVLEAWNYGYFGGRIELYKLGYFPKVYSYDINSAYPTAIAKLPQCNYTWRKIKWEDRLNFKHSYFSIWKVRYNFDGYLTPFPHRNADGSIQFRECGTGWYWEPEVTEAKRLYGDAVEVLGGYIQSFAPLADFTTKIKQFYKLRREFKEKGDSVEYVYKITLNSIYGKFAQSVGSAIYRNLAYAGFITSFTRAQLLRYIKNPHSVIGFATDCVYSTEPLDVPCGNALGEWTDNGVCEGTFIMPGLYRLRQGGKDKIAQRGYGSKLDFQSILFWLNETGKAPVKVQNFIGYKRATTQYKAFGEHYLKFVEYEKEINPQALKKRKYNFNDTFKWDKEWIDSLPYRGRSDTMSHIYQKAVLEESVEDFEDEI